MTDRINSPQEKERIRELFSLDILDTKTETQYNELVQLASTITDCPVSLISLVDSNRQWFKAKHGLEETETPRDISFCTHAIEAEDDFFIVEDATKDPRFSDNPLVVENPNIKFYAGRKLTTSKGFNIGTLCVIDTKKKKLSDQQKNQLNLISKQIIYLIESRRELANEKIKSTKAMAFISSISHEIRTPLTSVIGYTDVISKAIKDQESKKIIADHIETIKNNANHLGSLIGDVLDFTKLESGKVNINIESVSLPSIMKQIKSLLQISIDKNNIDFKLSITKNSPKYVYTDPTLLKQIIINIASNAIKFTNKNEVRIDIDFLEPQNTLQICIKDSGIGMTKEESETLFKPFEQANVGIQKKYKGTGLGMAISKELVEIMGGNIKLISSELNVGSQFRITIPTGKVETKIPLIKSQKENSKERKLKKVLIIDDVKENRFLLRHFLGDNSIEIVEAQDAKEAMMKYDKSFDVIFVDMQLPDMTGIDLFKELYKKSNANQRFIAFTASLNSQKKENFLDIGFDSFLSKPFNKESLTQSLKC
jgi:signal transduction histidine kinase